MTKPDNYRKEPPDTFDGSQEEWLALTYDQQYYRCHKEKRREQKNSRRSDRVEFIRTLKEESGCAVCDEDHPAALVFHHEDGANKEFHVSEMADHSKDKIRREVEKCEILCANCHRKYHASAVEL